ncbi:1-acylglycerol-3-phosphate O-acyltransferase [Aureococcus anophagefferens]|nr:1-acylglycerol-3-phosphate O-acyltransferase [Aureococcus anophagefferens]
MAVRDASGTLPQRRSARALRKAERRLVAGIAEARDDPISDDEWLHCLELTLSEDRDDTLVMLPGYGLGAGAFTMVLRDLQAQGAGATFGRAVALDWPGTGLASRFDRRNLSLKELVDYAVERLEAWRARRGFERVTLLGHSLGGYLAFCYCERYGASVARHLVLASPLGVPTYPAWREPPVSEAAWLARKQRDLEEAARTPSTAGNCGAAACGASGEYVGMAKFKRNGQWAGGLKPRFADYVDAFATHCAYESFGEYFYEKCVIGYSYGTFWAREPLGGDAVEIPFVDGALQKPPFGGRPSSGRLQAFLRARDAANDGFRCSFFFGCEDWIDCRVVVDAARGAACVNGPTGGAMHRIERCAHQSMVDHPAAFARAVLLLSRGAA